MAELKEDELLPGELRESDLEEVRPPGHDEKTTVSPDGVVRREVIAVPPADPEDVKPTPVQEKGLLDKIVSKVADHLAPETETGALAAGVSKGAPLGFGDELYGLLNADADVNEKLRKGAEDVEHAKASGTYDPSAAAPDIPGVTSYQLKREGQPTLSVSRAAKISPREPVAPEAPDVKKAYVQARDSMRDLYKRAEDPKTGHPNYFTAGEIGGSLAVPLPGVGKAKGLAKVGKYTATGAGLGFASGFGNSEADLTEGKFENFGKAAVDTGAGTAGGALFGGVLGYGASKLDPLLESMAARRAYKALDPYMKTIAESLGPDATKGEILAEAQRLGQRTLDESIIPEGAFSRWANSEKLAENALSKVEEAGQLKGATVDMAQDALSKAGAPTPVSLGRLATRIEQEAESAKLAGNQKLARKLMKEATDMRQTIVDRASAGYADPAAQTLQEAEKFKTGLQKQVDYGAKKSGREAQTAVARFAKEQAEKAIEAGLGPEELEMFKAVKGRYGDLQSISDVANYGAVRGFRNNVVGPGDKIAAAAGAAAAGGPAAIPAALATAGAHHFANHRGAAGLARTLSNASKKMSPLMAPVIEQGASRFDERDEEEQPTPPWSVLGGRH